MRDDGQTTRCPHQNGRRVHQPLTFRNANPFFEGRTPLEIMAQGDLISLYETYRRIEQIHCGEIIAA